MDVETPSVLSRALPEPRWPAVIALIGVGLLNDALPSYLIFGPKWMITGLAIVLLVPALISHHEGKHEAAKILSFDGQEGNAF